MSLPANIYDESLTEVSFKDTNFLKFYGLHEANVIDYFALSQFYDKSCLNEQIRMQARFNELQAHQLDRRGMTGIEYEVMQEYLPQQPKLFVIRKQYRYTKDKTETLATYYIVDGTIYQSPDVFTMVSNRILTSLYFVQKAFHETLEEVRFYPSHGYTWAVDSERAANWRRRQRRAQQKLLQHEQSEPGSSATNQTPVILSSAEQRIRAEEFLGRVNAMLQRTSAVIDTEVEDGADEEEATESVAEVEITSEREASVAIKEERVPIKKEPMSPAPESARKVADETAKSKRKKKDQKSGTRAGSVSGSPAPLPEGVKRYINVL
ncbi:MED6 mediator sub complex component-domain-containing protein [Cladochytrium replicatum]|nr:MED6 mediator sub complex component-domain-containing protein [Cladochytrium replicatum]